MLYELGELDKNLLPKSADRWGEDLAEFLGDHQREVVEEGSPKPGTRKRVQPYTKLVKIHHGWSFHMEF